MKKKHIDIARAWKDENYFNSLSEEERAEIPPNPAGVLDLTDELLENVIGGNGAHFHQTIQNEDLQAVTLTFGENFTVDILTLRTGAANSAATINLNAPPANPISVPHTGV